MAGDFIPVCRPVIAGREQEYVSAAVASGWISSAGEYLTRFESKFAEFVGCAHGVGCSNGTAAVQLALLAAGVGPGDRVVVPSFTMMASVFPILVQGAEPIFVDLAIARPERSIRPRSNGSAARSRPSCRSTLSTGIPAIWIRDSPVGRRQRARS